MERASPVRARPTTIVITGFACAVLYVAALTGLGSRVSYEIWSTLLIGPILFVVSLPILAHEARREGDRTLFWLLVFALALKLLGGVVRYYANIGLYGGTDSTGYYKAGLQLAAQFRHGDFTGIRSLSGSDFVNFLTGLVLAGIGPTALGGFVFFSWLGFWGLFFFYRAFRIGVPEGRSRSYARLVFFLPTLLFWPSEIGKESWMMLTLGLGALGAALLFSGKTWRGLALAALGLWLAGFVRLHMAALMMVALAAGYLFKKPRESLRQLAPIAKTISAVAILVLAYVFVKKAEAFLQQSGINLQQGVGEALSNVQTRTGGGGSSFTPSVLQSPLHAPVAFLTVLFRPFIFEAHNAQSAVAALEGTFLLAFSVARWRWFVAAVKSIRRQPYIAFALVYTLLFVAAFSGFANFGTLARERSQVFPLYLALFCVSPIASRLPRREGRESPAMADVQQGT